MVAARDLRCISRPDGKQHLTSINIIYISFTYAPELTVTDGPYLTAVSFRVIMHPLSTFISIFGVYVMRVCGVVNPSIKSLSCCLPGSLHSVRGRNVQILDQCVLIERVSNFGMLEQLQFHNRYVISYANTSACE